MAKLLHNLTFDIDFENKGMGYLMNDSLSPEKAALKAISSEPDRMKGWLEGVTSLDGKPGLETVKAKLGL